MVFTVKLATGFAAILHLCLSPLINYSLPFPFLHLLRATESMISLRVRANDGMETDALNIKTTMICLSRWSPLDRHQSGWSNEIQSLSFFSSLSLVRLLLNVVFINSYVRL